MSNSKPIRPGVFPSLSDHHGKFQLRRTCNSGLPRCQESLRQCLEQWPQVQNLPA